MQASPISSCFELLLRPLARAFLKRGLAFQDFSEMAKRAFVQVAKAELERETPKVNPSRIMAATGLHRNEVNRMLEPSSQDAGGELGLTARLVTQWEQDKRFSNGRGRARPLTLGDGKGGFDELVRSVNTHMTPGTMLFQLERLGLVRRVRQRVRLERPVEQVRNDPEKLYELCARDLETLLTITEQNLRIGDVVPHMHLRTEYDGIYADKVPHIREWILREGRAFHKRIRDFISEFDADLNPDPKRSAEPKRRVVLGTFGYSEE
jgi:hypothetical protein